MSSEVVDLEIPIRNCQRIAGEGKVPTTINRRTETRVGVEVNFHGTRLDTRDEGSYRQ